MTSILRLDGSVSNCEFLFTFISTETNLFLIDKKHVRFEDEKDYKIPELPENVYIYSTFCLREYREKHRCLDGDGWKKCRGIYYELKERWTYYYVVMANGAKVEMWKEVDRVNDQKAMVIGAERKKLWRAPPTCWFGVHSYPCIPIKGSIDYGEKKEPRRMYLRRNGGPIPNPVLKCS